MHTLEQQNELTDVVIRSIGLKARISFCSDGNSLTKLAQVASNLPRVYEGAICHQNIGASSRQKQSWARPRELGNENVWSSFIFGGGGLTGGLRAKQLDEQSESSPSKRLLGCKVDSARLVRF